MFTVSSSNNVHSILNNWCICINNSCGVTCLTSEIGTPEPQLEPQITSLAKCKIDQSILEDQFTKLLGLGSRVPNPSVSILRAGSLPPK